MRNQAQKDSESTSYFMEERMTGKIMKGIGGFYYVYVEQQGLYECRARGIFRNKKMKPNVGDVVDIDVLS